MTVFPSPGWSIRDWRSAYDAGTLTPECLFELKRKLPAGDPAWISIASDDNLTAQLTALARRLTDVGGNRERLPLYGVPFAVKDNIDAAGFETTAACSAFAYRPANDATVVAKLRQAGAIVLGKTNLDQFATGLVGTRSPYGVVPNSFDARYISGGSSSGSGSVVARGLVPFALGTDTAGSGRVPAALNNIVGLKPTRGGWSTRGVVPACRTLDCVSVFTLTVDDARLVLDLVEGFDAEDAYSRPSTERAEAHAAQRRVAIPNELEFNGDATAQRAFEATVERLRASGWSFAPVDFRPFRDLARMLYEGPWVAERYIVMEPTLASAPVETLDPTVKTIVENGNGATAVQAFRAEYQRAALARQIAQTLAPFDALLVPTIPTAFTQSEVAAEPIRTNSLLGTYTNFTNLADLCGLAVPGVFRDDGLPAGVTLLAAAWQDRTLLTLGAEVSNLLALPRGATGVAHTAIHANVAPAESFFVAVVGAHLSGLALNHQLTMLAGSLVRETTTAAKYKLYVLPNTTPVKPGMIRTNDGGSLTVEVWQLPPEGFARFVALVPPPLCIGNVELSDGTFAKGFLCEPHALQGATEITTFGGFRHYLESIKTSN